jgi:Spy/CpxP family protein refolding chaperone
MMCKHGLILFVGMALAMPAALISQEPPHHGPEHPERNQVHHCPMLGSAAMVLMHRDDLALTPEQTEQVESLHAEFQQTQVQAAERMQPIHHQMARATERELFDEQAVRAAAREAAALHADLMVAMHRARHQVSQILTPEQRQQLEQLHEQHHPPDAAPHAMGMMMHCPMMEGMPHRGSERHEHRDH